MLRPPPAIGSRRLQRPVLLANDKRAKARERKRRQREREQQKPNEGGHADVHGCHASSRMSRHTDTDSDTDTDADAVHSRPPSSDRQGQEKGHCVTAHEGFDAFWKVYPKKRKKKAAREIWVRKKLSSMADLRHPTRAPLNRKPYRMSRGTPVIGRKCLPDQGHSNSNQRVPGNPRTVQE